MSKFMLGLGTGIYLGTYYNFKPAVEYIKIEATSKFTEVQKILETPQEPKQNFSFWKSIRPES